MYFLIIPLKALDIDIVSETIITTTVHYAISRVAEMEARTFVDHFESALRYIIEHPGKLVGDVRLINDLEMGLLTGPGMLTGHVNTNGENDSEPSRKDPMDIQNISELIQLQVERTPHKVAVCGLVWRRIYHNIFFPAPVRPRCVFNL